MAPVSARKKLERLRTFFKFCIESGWALDIPARLIKSPLARPTPTLPFTDSEIEKILWATEVYPNKGIYGLDSGRRVRAFINLLRYSGLRIRDAATLSQEISSTKTNFCSTPKRPGSRSGCRCRERSRKNWKS